MNFTRMIALADRIDRLTTGIGRAVAWLALAVVLLQFVLVLTRDSMIGTSLPKQPKDSK